MKTKFTRTFLRELAKVPLPIRERIENVVFTETLELDKLDIKKISGTKNYYRIRIGSYRIGMKREKDTVEFRRVLHRRDIYKEFP